MISDFLHKFSSLYTNKMAEAEEIIDLSNEENLDSSECISGLECAVCLQPCVHPAQLPCQHIFCFLCIKGIAFQSGRCAMCREPIPTEFIFKPKLLTPLKCNGDDTYQWYYEGGSGWWQYDLRASAEIEESFQKGEKSCSLLLAGFLYVIDFAHMVQYRQTNPLRRRKIKRDLSNTDNKLGVAGLTENTLKRQVDDINAGMQHLWNGSPGSSSRSVQPGAEIVTSPFNRTDSENYGLESLGPDEYPADLGFQVVSPSMRDGRCFNPRLDLGESDDEDSDEVIDIDDDDDEDDDVPRIRGGPSVSPGTFRPLPMRAPAASDGRELSPRPENR